MSAVLEEIDFAGKIDERQSQVPGVDGYTATKLELRFNGAATLDSTAADDLALLEGGRLGKQVRLIVVAEGSSKGFKLNRKLHDDELSFTLTLKVLSVEAAEIA